MAGLDWIGLGVMDCGRTANGRRMDGMGWTVDGC
jgi:hypothetical protein